MHRNRKGHSLEYQTLVAGLKVGSTLFETNTQRPANNLGDRAYSSALEFWRYKHWLKRLPKTDLSILLSRYFIDHKGVAGGAKEKVSPTVMTPELSTSALKPPRCTKLFTTTAAEVPFAAKNEPITEQGSQRSTPKKAISPT